MSNYDENLKYLNNFDIIDVSNAEGLDESFSNFRLFGIGKESEKQKQNKQRRKEFRSDLKKELRGKDKFKALLTLSQRYNPAAAIPRAGVLAGARVNIFGVSVRLYPAFLTAEEAKKKKIRVDAIQPAKEAWEKVSKFWRGLGGNPESLKKAIMNGYNKPVFKWTKSAKKRKDIAKSGFDGVSVSVKNSNPIVDYLPTRTPSGDRLEDAVFNEPDANRYIVFNLKNISPAFYDDQLIDSARIFLNEYGTEDYFSNVDGSEWWAGEEFYSNAYDGGASVAISAGIGLLGAIAGMINKAGAKKNPYEEGVNAQLEAEINAAEKNIEPITADEVRKIQDAAEQERAAGLPLEGDDEKIMGINKTWFWVGVGAIALVGGLFVYKKFIAKK